METLTTSDGDLDHPAHATSLRLTNDLQHLTRRQIKRSGNQATNHNIMAGAKKSLAEELMDAINYYQMKAHPSYISESDAVSIGDFTCSELAEKYALDTVNLYWPGKVNKNHVFEIYSEFLPHGDAGKTRCDMINFVSDHKERYAMDGHTVLKMHKTNLTNWACKMTYFENGADELGLYALSDLTKKHTVVITNNRPWTTVHPDIGVHDIYHLLDMCDVRLLYLGDCKFGRLRNRPKNCNNPVLYNPPVFPGCEPPGLRELETAESLLMMQRQVTDESTLPTTSVDDLNNVVSVPFGDAMESVVDRVLSPVELCVQKGLDAMDKLCSIFDRDAMYVITGYIEPLVNYGQPLQDCMDVLVETRCDAMESITDYIEPKIKYGQPKHDGISVLVETEELYALVDPAVGLQLKNCTVRLTKITYVLSFVPEKDLCHAVLSMGRPHTHSQCTPKPPRTQRHPRKAHKTSNYHDTEATSEDEPLRKQGKTNPVGSGPSDSRILVQNSKTDPPKQRELRILSDTPVTSETGNEDLSDADTELYSPPEDEVDSGPEQPAPKGKFTIKTKSLKKPRSYNCSFCDKTFTSAKLLVAHHNKSHKILYCKDCSHAFKNKTTYKRHVRSHSVKGVTCNDCGKKFAYQSQLNTHKAVHSTTRFKCDHINCDKSFKNIGDLTHHKKQHTAPKHKCPDCDYANVDMRNFESHQLFHSRIIKYYCDHCNKEFVYNSQLQRHIKDNVCQRIKQSFSPDY